MSLERIPVRAAGEKPVLVAARSDDLRAVIDEMTDDRIAADKQIGHLEAERAALTLAKMDLLAELEKTRIALADEAKLRAEIAAALNAATEKAARLQASAHEWEASARHGWTIVQRRESALLALAQQLADLQHADFGRETAAAAAVRLPDIGGAR